jgi:transposase
LKDYYLCDNKGKRWESEFTEDFHKRLIRSNGKDRVKADWKKLQRWYRALDKLIKNKEKIELEIYRNMKNLFSLKVDIIFYDITSIYFEGSGPKNLAKFGFSRDGKKDNKQILLGIVMADGLPIAHHVFAGNTQDKETLDFIIKDLKKRFELKNLIFVADRGITTIKNVKKLDDIGYKYILGVSLRNLEKAKEILNTASELKWEKYDDTTKYTFIEIKEEDKIEKWILVDSKEKKEYERRMRKVWMEKGAKELNDLKERVKKGNLKDEKKIAYYLGEVSKKYHVKRYFNWKIKKGKFTFSIDDKKLEFEENCEGKYLLRTTDDKLTTQDVIREYKNLWEIESCFREIKDVIKIRPIHHQTTQRVKAHVFIAVIAYLIEKIIQRRIRSTGMRITPQDTLKFSKSIKVVELEVLERTIKLITQRIEKVTEEIFHIFGIRLPKSFKKVEIEKFTYQKCVQRELFY